MITRKFENFVCIRLEKGDEVCSSLMAAVLEHGIKLGVVSGIGTLDRATVGLFKASEKKYYPNTFKGDFEISSLTGNITTMNQKPYIHLHIAMSDVHGNTFGGHLSEGYVSATAEIFITACNAEVNRKYDENIGLNLLEI